MTLSFDIETVGVDPDSLDEYVKAKLTKNDKEGEPSALDMLALSPFTGRVVVIAAWDDEKNQGVCLTVGDDAYGHLPSGFVHRDCASEAEMLRAFWDVCSRQRRFATFNGNDFDVPYLLGRSVANHVPVHRPLFVAKPWEDTHVDVCQRLKTGFRGKPSLDLVCRALGVPTPKGGGIDGADVGKAWDDGRRNEVAAYCCRDTKALADVLAAYDASMGQRVSW